MRVLTYEAHHADALARLFVACECPCYCRFWHFAGDKNAWLARCAEEPEKNEDEMRRDGAMSGILALHGDEAIGWMKLAPRVTLAKLRNRPVYRTLDLGPDEGVLSIGCVLVHPAHRRRGVARALVASATAVARERGAHAIEAYPHAAKGLGDHEAWMGPHELFVSLGYRMTAGAAPYPVMRLVL